MNSSPSIEITGVESDRIGPRGGITEPGSPIAIYEVHPGSWMRVPEENNRPLDASVFASKLAAYARGLNFTHVQLLMSPEPSVIQTPDDLKYFVDQLHKQEIGVILDGMPASIPPATDGFQTGGVVSMVNSRGGFELKWDRQWSHDILYYLGEDPIRRRHHHDQLLARANYAFSDRFLLPLSHDEVMRGKKSLLAKMPGDEWQKFANVRLLFANQQAQPGKKLLFMGGEFGQWNEWNPDASLDWHVVRSDNRHGALQRWVADLNHCYLTEPALYQTDADPEAFEWVDYTDAEMSIVSWLRKDAASGDVILAAFNFTPVPRHNLRIGVPTGGGWNELLNSDAHEYGGSGQGNLGGVVASPFGWNYKSHSLTVTLPPLGAVFFKAENPT